MSGETEEELLKRPAAHAVNEHGYKEAEIMTPCRTQKELED
jgi:hypothetical protein